MAIIGVLGSTGMLGSALCKYLTAEVAQLTEINRTGTPIVFGNPTVEVDVTELKNLSEVLKNQRFDYLINAIGLIKQLIIKENENDVKLAYSINSDFPALLNDYSQKYSIPIIQIGTDCVYSGVQGNYNEDSEFDGTDLYGLSKISGELLSQSTMILRTSIVGREINSKNSLMDWFLSQEQGACIQGFTNHFWNGVTTLEFAKVVIGIIKSNNFSPGVMHLVPANQSSKFELLQSFRTEFDRLDINIEPREAGLGINRTLSTLFPERNIRFWSDAGYNEVPTIDEMIRQYARWTSSSSS